ncbi:phosphohistidine phosphatase [Hamadaea flava]|uniref:SixA phosphatase family protein n=1 Tax=Hamadaea flava TaxID=1742688 RepID=A0ABV8LPC4_9ACTN|nr:histidine phosphatase family protein [Hamadaea flava]MCP2324110.1 phosphohistidine phosphatase [Hamadaea flava]
MTARTLVLLRHAKADRPSGIADTDRPLTDRGHADAAAAGAWLLASGHVPDLVLCSPARRTRQTWHSVAIALGGAGSPKVQYERELYDGELAEALDLIAAAAKESAAEASAGKSHTILLIGHNPTISQLSAALDQAGQADSDGLRTSGIAVHELPDEWHAGTVAPLRATHTARAD